MLTGRGVTAWRNAITGLIPAAPAARPGSRPSPVGQALPAGRPPLPAALTAELISVLAGLVLAGTVP